MTDQLILAIDNGTQSLRALAFTPNGELVDIAQITLDAYRSEQPGWMEHDTAAFYTALCEACQSLWRQGRVRAEQIAAVVVTTQRATVVALDADGHPLRPAIIWADQRRARVESKRPLMWRVLFNLLGLKSTIDRFESACEANWIAQNQPDIWAKTAHFLLLSGYLNYRLTGDVVDSIGNQVGYIPFDYKAQDWCAERSWQWSSMPIRRHQLPRLVQTGERLGVITAQAAHETGLAAGTPVIAGAGDKACEVLGSGCLDATVGSISCGTTATVNATHARYVEPRPFVPPYPAALPRSYLAEIQIYRGFWMITWFKREFGHLEVAQEQPSAERLFDELLAQTPAGADGLMLQPLWNPGVGEPGPEARGSVIGFTDTHTRAHLYRAIIEGLGYALREGKERLEQRGRTRMQSVRLAGGGSQSDAVMQIFADILNCPTERPATYEASGLGAAIIGAVALGLHKDFQSAAQCMTHTTTRFEPDRERAALYDRLYREVYRPQYKRLRPLYQKLLDIYPR